MRVTLGKGFLIRVLDHPLCIEDDGYAFPVDGDTAVLQNLSIQRGIRVKTPAGDEICNGLLLMPGSQGFMTVLVDPFTETITYLEGDRDED